MEFFIFYKKMDSISIIIMILHIPIRLDTKKNMNSGFVLLDEIKT